MAYINGKEIVFSPHITMDFTEENEAIRAENERLQDENNTLHREIVMMSNERDEAVTMLKSTVSPENVGIVIPDGVEEIREYAFYRHPMTSIIIPPTVTTIGRAAFNTCMNCLVYDFSRHTAIPTLSNVNVFSSMNSSAKIIVPSNLYDEWIVATNWLDYSSNIFKAPSPDEFYYHPQTDRVIKLSVGEVFRNNVYFYASDPLTLTGLYISELYEDVTYNQTHELSDTGVGGLVEMDGRWDSDWYAENGFDIYGHVFSGYTTFHRSGIFRMYATFAYVPTDANEAELTVTTAGFIFEVT